MRRRRPLRGRIHLLEAGVRWPPETFLRDKFQGLVARGFAVTVACPAAEYERGPRIPGVRLVKLPEPSRSRVALLAALLRHGTPLAARSPRRLAATVRAARTSANGDGGGTTGLLRAWLPLARVRPDVVHFEWNESAIRHLPLFDVWDRPVVTSCHGTHVNVLPWLDDGFRRDLAETFERATAVHCISDTMAAEAGLLGLRRDKVELIHNAVDPQLFAPNGGPPEAGDLRLLAVGHLRWMKGYEYALMAVRRMLDAGVPVRLDIVGEGRERRRIAFSVADLGLGDRVRLHGKAERARVRELLQRSHALLIASSSEGVPVAALEAMASGVPVIAADCGGIRDAVTDGIEGRVVSRRDPAALAAAAEELWRDPARRAAMGAAGRRRVEAEFGLDRHVDAFATLYERVIA